MDRKKLKFITWFLFELSLPVLFVIAIWPISEYLLNIPHSYERALSSADMLPLGALILIGVVIETSFDDTIKKESAFLVVLIIFASFVSICLLFFYGFMKSESVDFDFSIIGTSTDSGKMTLFASISVAAIVFCCVYALLIRLTGALNKVEGK